MRATTAKVRPDWLAFGWQENGEHRVVSVTEVSEIALSAEAEEETFMSASGPISTRSIVTSYSLEARFIGEYTVGGDVTWRGAAEASGLDRILGALGVSTEALEVLYEIGAEHAETKEQVAALEKVAEYLGR